jgi:hypothetical protein
MTSCSLIVHWRLGGTYSCPTSGVESKLVAWHFVFLSSFLRNVFEPYRTRSFHIPEGDTFRSHRCEHLKCDIFAVLLRKFSHKESWLFEFISFVFHFWQWSDKGQADSTKHDWSIFYVLSCSVSVGSRFEFSFVSVCTGYDWWCCRHFCLVCSVWSRLRNKSYIPRKFVWNQYVFEKNLQVNVVLRLLRHLPLFYIILKNLLLCNWTAHDVLRFITCLFGTVLVYCCYTHIFFSFAFSTPSYCVRCGGIRQDLLQTLLGKLEDLTVVA